MLRSIGLTSLFALLLVSCGGAQIGPTSASGTVTQTQATALKAQLDQLIASVSPTSLQSPGTIVSVPGVTVSSVKQQAVDAFDACTTVTPTTSVDNDADGIAASKTTTFNCYGVTLPGHEPADRVGTFVVSDDDTKSVNDGGEYTMTYDVEFSSTDYSSLWNGEHGLRNENGNLRFYGRYLATFEERGAQGGYESNYEQFMVPTDPVDPFAAGTMEINGFHRLILVGPVTIDNVTRDVDWDITFGMTSGGLEYEDTGQSGCITFFKAGYWEFQDSAQNSIRYDYSCTSIIYTFNGTQISVTGTIE